MTRNEVSQLQKVIFVGLFAGLTACQQGTNDQQTSGRSNEELKAPTPGKTMPTEAMTLSEQIESSNKDLAERLGIEPDSIVLGGVRKVNWRNGAIGCPMPGKSYTQALVPGIVIVLQASGQVYSYHAKTGGKPFHCPNDRIEIPTYIQTEDIA